MANLVGRRRISLAILVLFIFTSGLLYYREGSTNTVIPAALSLDSNLGFATTTVYRTITIASTSTNVPEQQSDLTATVVVASISKDDTTWLSEKLPDLKTVIYVADAPTSRYNVPKNKGHEAMVYLTYIIDHYDELSDVSIFIHAERFGWHNNLLSDGDSVTMLQELNLDFVRRMGYFNLRCSQSPGCDRGISLRSNSTIEETAVRAAWPELHPSSIMPAELFQPCCAQFATSRDAIRAHPRQQYVAWRNWLLDTKLDDYLSGRVWEFTWQYVFTGHAEVCMATHLCYCGGFSICMKSYADSENYWLLHQEHEKETLFGFKEWKSSLNYSEMYDAEGTVREYEKKLDFMLTQLTERKAAAIERGNDPAKRRKALEENPLY